MSAASPPESVPGFYERVRRGLRAGGLPIGEALHPVTLAALALLIVNDWVMKPRFGPSLVTGKLSDIAGLVAAPLLLSALIGLALWAASKLGADTAAPVTAGRLAVCVAATGLAFTAVKLSERAAGWFVAAVELLGRPAEVFLDPSDLLCLPALAVAWWIGRDEIRRQHSDRAQRRPGRGARM
ncbi:MAG: hypothetical protein AB7O24_25810 [Kofleriaceae bacterium]